MAPHPHLTKAPITEALIDFRIKPEVEDFDALERFRSEVEADFPDAHEQRRLQAVVSVLGPGSPPQLPPPAKVGYMLRSGDGKRVVQPQLQGFSFSQLAPYDCWESLRDDASKQATKFFKIVGPRRVERWAVRYINRIEVPIDAEMGEYFRCVPVIPDTIPQKLDGMFVRLVIPVNDVKVILTEAVDEVRVGPHVGITLDIDVFQSAEPGIELAEAWRQLERLREIKNDVFYGSVTEKAWKAYL